MKNDSTELVDLLNTVNDIRRLHGDDPLEDLPLSEPENVHSCLIANAFNYDCEVNPSSMKTGWDKERPDVRSIKFIDETDARLYLKVIGLEPAEDYIVTKETFDEEFIYFCPLTDDMNNVALDFDYGEYPEYDENRYDEKGRFCEYDEWGNQVPV